MEDRERIKIIECYKGYIHKDDNSIGTYLLRVNSDLYEMSENCTQPNGVNLYMGNVRDFDLDNEEKLDFIPGFIVNGWLKRSGIYEIMD